MVRQGEHGDRFYLVGQGAFEVFVNGQAVLRLTRGDYFGLLLTGIHSVTRHYNPRLIAIQGTPQSVFADRLAWEQVDGWIVINDATALANVAPSGVPLVTVGTVATGLDCPR